MAFDVYQYRAVFPKGGDRFRMRKAKLVEKFDDLEAARKFVAGKESHFIRIPVEAGQHGI